MDKQTNTYYQEIYLVYQYLHYAIPSVFSQVFLFNIYLPPSPMGLILPSDILQQQGQDSHGGWLLRLTVGLQRAWYVRDDHGIICFQAAIFTRCLRAAKDH